MIKYKVNENTKIKYCDRIFEIRDKITGNIFMYKPQLEIDNSFNPDDFEIYFLYNSNYRISENSIYKVYADDTRIGWIFPIQSLESGEHDYAGNQFYLKYAYIALYKLLQMISFTDEEYSDFSILDYFPDNIQLLLYDTNNTKSIEDFDISKYTVSLFYNGYSYNGQGNVFTESEELDKNIKIKQLPVPIRNISYINVLFKELIPLHETSYSKFHLLYQIIEILIGVVFNYKIQELIYEIAGSANDLFDKREKLSDITTEKNRVVWLFNDFSRIEAQKLDILNELCIDLLEKNVKKINPDKTANNLYNVRCLIVHNLYSLDEDSRNLLEELNNSFLDVIFDILFTFKGN